MAAGRQWGSQLERGISVILFVIGLGHVLPGVYLLSLGGSPYYAIAGGALTVSGLLMWRHKPAAYLLYLLIWVATLIWAFWEVRADGWALLPRINLLSVGAVFVLLAWLMRSPARFKASRRVLSVTAIVLLLVGVGLVGWLRREPSARPIGPLAPINAASLEGAGEWPSIGGTNAAERFSPLEQITPANVSGLEVAWKVRLGMPPQGMVGALQATPLKVGDTLYTCGMANEVVALDPETGAQRWKFDPQIDRKGIMMAPCRGVTYVPASSASDACGARIVLLTHDVRMIAVRARDGKLCQTFGEGGEVDLTEGMGPVKRGYLFHSSPAILVRGKLIMGSSVLDNQSVEEPSGVIRGYDAWTGRFAWAWDMERPGETGMPESGETFTPGTPNAWPPLTGDDALGAVYIPLGNATPDYVANHRTPAMEKFNDAVVALDAATGRLIWSFQTTHRDVWDYDNPSPPTLTDFPVAGGRKPAVIIPTKRGVFFVLDRRTGEPLVRTIERPVPQNPAPGEKLSPTQPYPVGMPSFSGDPLTEARMWGITPFDQMWCRIKFRESRYDGEFTPVGLKYTLVYPGYYGGSEWSGVAVDPTRRIMVLNVMYLPLRNRLVPRKQADPSVYRPFDVSRPLNVGRWPQNGTDYAAETNAFISPINVPCTQPPYSEVAAVDLKMRSVLWRRPLGTARDSGPFGLRSGLPIKMGVPAVGGALVTKSGLMFMAASQDRTFRAFDTRTGRILWENRLPAAGHANPMSYYSARSGRQFVVVSASGHPQLQDGEGDYLVAYALPRRGD